MQLRYRRRWSQAVLSCGQLPSSAGVELNIVLIVGRGSKIRACEVARPIVAATIVTCRRSVQFYYFYPVCLMSTADINKIFCFFPSLISAIVENFENVFVNSFCLNGRWPFREYAQRRFQTTELSVCFGKQQNALIGKFKVISQI